MPGTGTARSEIGWSMYRPLVLSSCGFGSADSILLQQAVVSFNSQLSLTNVFISVTSALASPTPTQKVSSGMIEVYVWDDSPSFLESSSPVNRAHPLTLHGSSSCFLLDISGAEWAHGQPEVSSPSHHLMAIWSPGASPNEGEGPILLLIIMM